MTRNQSFKTLLDNVLIEEETTPGYDPKVFYAMSPGQVLDGRFKILVKLGWGSTSTVWLAEDISRWFWQINRYVAIKIAVSNYRERATYDSNIIGYLRKNPSHKGFKFVRVPMEHFEVRSPHGIHSCFVYEPLRETLRLFQRRLPNGKLPVSLLKVFLQQILLGLDYLHSECGIVHTDIKSDNIMLTFESPLVLRKFVQNLAEDLMLRKVREDRVVYLSHIHFGEFESDATIPKLIDFGLSQQMRSPEQPRYPIQPPLFQAPEVMLGTGWSQSADIWNLGVLIWNLLENRNLFQDIYSEYGTYDSRKHFAQMVALLGLPPKELLDREKEWGGVKWSRAFPDMEGKLVWTAREYYGGPFFDSEGNFLCADLTTTDCTFSKSVSSLEGKDKDLFLDFASHMLQWLPENRMTAKDLLQHAWLSV